MYDILITGTTGMVGKGVLLTCLQNPKVNTITLISRTSIGINDPRVKEVLLKDFMEIESIKNELGKPNACFHCMGVSAMGLNEEQYHHLTFNITKKLSDLCYDLNPGMIFNYVSGQGTDSSEKGRIMWARVKGKTENYILQKGFKKAFMFRPGLILPEGNIRSRVKTYNVLYAILRPLFPFLKKLNSVTTTDQVGMAMINSLNAPPSTNPLLENKDINLMAK